MFDRDRTGKYTSRTGEFAGRISKYRRVIATIFSVRR